MRTLLEVTRFEIRYQLRSPFFLGALLMFALIHFLAITGTAIHIDISNQVAINSAYAILQIELVLFIFGMLLVDAMPFLVEIGVLLDLFVGIFVVSIIIHHINREFASLDTRRLAALKE